MPSPWPGVPHYKDISLCEGTLIKKMAEHEFWIGKFVYERHQESHLSNTYTVMPMHHEYRN